MESFHEGVLSFGTPHPLRLSLIATLSFKIEGVYAGASDQLARVHILIQEDGLKYPAGIPKENERMSAGEGPRCFPYVIGSSSADPR